MPSCEVQQLTHASKVLGRDNKRVFALVPEQAVERQVPICYYLHGWGGNAEAFLNHKGVRAVLQAADQISVFPESFRNWFINDHRGRRYEDYLIQEVLPVAERTWLPKGTRKRMISGFSMGGLSALCMMWRHSETFAGGACFAGAFEAPQRTGDPYAEFRDRPDLLMPSERNMLDAWGAPNSPVRQSYDPYCSMRASHLRAKQLYLSIGTNDFDRMIAMNRRLHELLVQGDVPHAYEEYTHGHDLDLVAASLPAALVHLGIDLELTT